jgi:hypothetical protein
VIVETAFEKQYENQRLFGDIYSFMVNRNFVFRGYISDSDFYPLFKPVKRINSIFVNNNNLQSIEIS